MFPPESDIGIEEPISPKISLSSLPGKDPSSGYSHAIFAARGGFFFFN